MEVLKRIARAIIQGSKEMLIIMTAMSIIFLALTVWQTIFKTAPILAVLFFVIYIGRICVNLIYGEEKDENKEE